MIIIGATEVVSVQRPQHRPCQSIAPATRNPHPIKKRSACHAKGYPNDTASLFRAFGRGEPRRLEAALSHLAVHLTKPRVRSGAGRSEGPWICAVDEEVHEIPDCARHTDHARMVQEVGRGVRRGALTLLPAAKSSATSRHRLQKALRLRGRPAQRPSAQRLSPQRPSGCLVLYGRRISLSCQTHTDLGFVLYTRHFVMANSHRHWFCFAQHFGMPNTHRHWFCIVYAHFVMPNSHRPWFCMVYAALVCAMLDPCGRRDTLAWSVLWSLDGNNPRRA